MGPAAGGNPPPGAGPIEFGEILRAWPPAPVAPPESRTTNMTFSSHQKRLAAWAAIAVALWLLLSLLAPVLMPFLMAGVLAYVLHPVVEKMHARHVPRWLGAGVALTLLILVALSVLLLIVPVITKQVPVFKAQVPLLLDKANVQLQQLGQRWGIPVQIDVSHVREWIRELVAGNEGDIIGHLLSSLRIGGSALAAVFGNLMLTPVVAYYLLLDWASLMERCRQLVPPRWREGVHSFLAETDAVLGQYLRGQLVVMGVLAVFYTVGLMLAGLDLALPIGVFTGLAVFVPYLGFGLGMVIGLLAAALQFQAWEGVILVGVVYMVGQAFESFFVTPRLLGERIGLHPITVIFALMAFGHLFGFVGVLLALPASAVLLVAARRLRRGYLASDLYLKAPVPAAAPGAAPMPRDEDA
jgi:predicted PurR-regulated permease PerM